MIGRKEPTGNTIFFILLCLIGIQTTTQYNGGELWLFVLMIAIISATLNIIIQTIDIFYDLKQQEEGG